MPQLKISHKALFAMLGVLIPSLLMFSALVIHSTREILHENMSREVRVLAEKSAQSLAELMEKSKDSLLTIAHNQKVENLVAAQAGRDRQQVTDSIAALEQSFLDLQNLDETIQAIRFIDADGFVMTKVREGVVIPRQGPLVPGLDLPAVSSKRGRDFFVNTMRLEEGEVWVSHLERGWMEDEEQWCPSMVRLSTPLFFADGSRAGLVIINVWGEAVGEMINRLISPVEGSAFLIEKNLSEPARNGIYLFHQDSTCEFGNQTGTQITIFQQYPQAVTQAWMTSNQGVVIHPESKDILAHYAYAPDQQGDRSWVVVVNAKRSFFLAPLATIWTRVLLSAALVLILTTLAAVFFSRSLTRPIQAVIDGTRRLSKDLDSRILVQSKDEVGYLAREINGMAASLQATLAEKKQMDEKVCHSEKLVSIGEMAAGLAHELNTPLSNIRALSSLAKKELAAENSDPASLSNDLNDILEQTEKCSQVISGLLSFARRQNPEYACHDVNQLIEKSLSLIRIRSENKGALIDFQRGADLPAVKVDGHQIHQVFVNLLLNALDAIETGGRVAIVADMADNRVRVRFSDNGYGIKAEHRHKIFDPFFTTKEVGKGTGLGLSVSYGILKSLGGSIEVESSAGGGATFAVSLPTGDY